MNLPPATVFTVSGPIGAGKSTITNFAIEGLFSRGIRGVHVPLAGALKLVASYGGIVKDPMASSEYLRVQAFVTLFYRYFDFSFNTTLETRFTVPQLLEVACQFGNMARSVLSEYAIILPEFTVNTPQDVVDELQEIQQEYHTAVLQRDLEKAKTLGRTFLQKFGTEAVREGIHPAMWTAIAMALILRIWEEAPGPIAFFVDDVRFLNEYELIRSLQRDNLKHRHIFIVRPGVNLSSYVKESTHASEKFLLELYRLADAVIVNDYTPKTLHSALGLILELFILAHQDKVQVEDAREPERGDP